MQKYIHKTLYEQWKNVNIVLQIINAPPDLLELSTIIVDGYQGKDINITKFEQMAEIEESFLKSLKNTYSNHVESEGIQGRYLYGLYLEKKLKLNNINEQNDNFYTKKGWDLFHQAQDFYILRRSIFHIIKAYMKGWDGNDIKDFPPTFAYNTYIIYDQIIDFFPLRFIEYMKIPYNKLELYHIQNYF
jgi:hypothetical protein